MANEIPREYVGSGEQPSRGFTCVKASIHIVQYSVHCQISRAGSAKPQCLKYEKCERVFLNPNGDNDVCIARAPKRDCSGLTYAVLLEATMPGWPSSPYLTISLHYQHGELRRRMHFWPLWLLLCVSLSAA